MAENKKIDLHFGIVALLVLLAAFSRILPHPPNFSPIGGIALFGAARFSRRLVAVVVPFASLWLSDLTYTVALFGLFALARRRIPQLQIQSVRP